jgi:hypothetical protein
MPFIYGTLYRLISEASITSSHQTFKGKKIDRDSEWLSG